MATSSLISDSLSCWIDSKYLSVNTSSFFRDEIGHIDLSLRCTRNFSNASLNGSHFSGRGWRDGITE